MRFGAGKDMEGACSRVSGAVSEAQERWKDGKKKEKEET